MTQQQTAVDQWNTRYPISTPVVAYPGARPQDDSAGERLITRTRSEAQLLGGHTAVVWVDGHDACIALTHVDPVQSAPADRATLRDRIAAAMREHYLSTNRDELDADRNAPCRCGAWREPGAEADDENDWDAHLADAVLAVLPAPPGRAEYDALVAEADRLRRDGVALHAKAVNVDTQLAELQKQVAAPVDRAAVLREAAAAIEAQQAREETTEWAQDGGLDHDTEIGGGYVRAAAALLRRMADETQPAETEAPVLSPAERTMLGYALDQAQEHIWAREGFTEEDQAAVDSLRRLTAKQPVAGARQDGAQR